MDEISKDEFERMKKLADARKRQLDRQNQFQKDNYKRVSVLIRKEIFEELKKVYPDISMNGYINGLIEKDLQSKKPLDFGECPF